LKYRWQLREYELETLEVVSPGRKARDGRDCATVRGQEGRGVIWAEDVERGERKTGGGLKVVFVELGVE